jgi:hypothetical protein
MQYKDFSPIPMRDGKLAFGDRLQGMLKFGFSWPRAMQSQEVVRHYLQRLLNNQYTLLRNLPLPDGVIVPLLLVGPQGVVMLNPSPTRGVFRAQENSWLAASGGGFRPDSPNLIQRTILYTRAVTAGLNTMGFSSVEVDGVLVFTDPGCHVDNIHATVRILLVDAIASFATRLLQERLVLGPEDVHKIISALSSSSQPVEHAEGIQGDFFEFQEPEKTPKRSEPSVLDRALAPVNRSLNFSTGQWVLLAVLAFLLMILFFA